MSKKVDYRGIAIVVKFVRAIFYFFSAWFLIEAILVALTTGYYVNLILSAVLVLVIHCMILTRLDEIIRAEYKKHFERDGEPK